MKRRSILGGLSLAATTGLAIRQSWPTRVPIRRPARSRVAVLRCDRYESCPRVIEDGLRLLAPKVRGKHVVLKPNLVEYKSDVAINTHPMVIAGAIEAIYRLGAATVVVAEGPGHVRDTPFLLEECGLADHLKAVGRTKFVDLNFDEVTRVPLSTGLTGLRELWLPNTVLAADVLISMPKVKTHHWAGVTLSLKNLFGIVPGAVYGWPKNILHWQGIDRSIVEIAAAIPIHYVVADGIVAMKGNGPLHGDSTPLGRLILADDPVVADATCCRLMQISPSAVRHLSLARPLGNLGEAVIDQLGEQVPKEAD
jgi:uncharacterized protein (DUF362 family)